MGFGALRSVGREWICQIAEHCTAQHHGGLKDKGLLCVGLGTWRSKADTAFGGFFQPVQQAQKCALARPVRTKDDREACFA